VSTFTKELQAATKEVEQVNGTYKRELARCFKKLEFTGGGRR